MLKGMPASGKTTIARDLVAKGGHIRVNRDLIRTMLHFDKFTGKNERATVQIEKAVVSNFIQTGYNVIIDDCNLNPNNQVMWEGVAKTLSSSFEVIDLTNVSMDECIKRDKERDKKVGEHVIKDMAIQYGLAGLTNIVVCDIDGTIADCSHRLKYARGEEKDWDLFFGAMHKDILRVEVLEAMFRTVSANNANVVFVTARPDTYRKETEDWLYNIAHVSGAHVVMRKGHDKRQDTEVKSDIYDKYLSQYNVVKVYDDRPSVIRMWREKGLDVVDVGQGIEF